MATTTVAMAGIATPALNTAVSKVSLSSSTSVKLNIRASSQSQETTSRRAFINILTAAAPAVLFAKEALAEANLIKLEGPPPPSGGLPGTDSADQARNLELPLKQRFYLQPLPPAEAIARAKESAKEITAVKALIDKKAWPYVQNDLRLRAEYLRLDLSTAVKSKPSAERKVLKPLLNQVFQNINDLDFAARKKSVEKAEKYYTITVSSLNDLIAKLG